MEIAPDTRMGLVELSVSDLDRSLAYWQDAIGLRVLSRENGTAELGADGAPLLRFVEEPGARPAQGFTGLFHVALLVPDRPSLGRFLAHAAREGIPLTGLSDHVVSEAIYLRDPDYHGIEIYADRPRESWQRPPAGAGVVIVTRPLDVADLLATSSGAPSEQIEPRTRLDRLAVMAPFDLTRTENAGLLTVWRSTPGLLGVRVQVSEEGDTVEGYHIHVGGGFGPDAGIGREIYHDVKAQDAPRTVERMLRAYLHHRACEQETFAAFTRRHELDALKALFEGKGQPLYVNHFYPNGPGWNPEWAQRFPEEYGYDPAKARALLADQLTRARTWGQW